MTETAWREHGDKLNKLALGDRLERLLEVLVHPGLPAAVDVHDADWVAWEVACYGIGEELYRDVVVFEGVVELIGLADGYAGVACVVQDGTAHWTHDENWDGRFGLRA